jgi:magnesium chelatase family protein
MEITLPSPLATPTAPSVAISCRSLLARGQEHQEIVVEALCMRGKQDLQVTGTVDVSLRESLEKIHCLLRQKNCWGATSQVLLHLLPPEIPKFGAHFELALYALALMALRGDEEWVPFSLQRISEYYLAASLTLDGRLIHTPYSERLCRERQDVVGADHFSSLAEFERFLVGEIPLPCPKRDHDIPTPSREISEISVDGLEEERFWMILAALWEAPVLLLGEPGIGKSHLARWAYTLLPPLEIELFRQCESVWKSSEFQLRGHRPFLAPHSRTRYSDFIGTSRDHTHQPGLYALANRGLLVLDEFNELNRDCRELLRTVLDEKKILRHTRSGGVLWDANFWLILTANPCECGYSEGRETQHCQCRPTALQSYRSRLSGPLLDRMFVKRFVLPKTTFDKNFLKLFCRITDTSAEDIRKKIPEWRERLKAIEQQSPRALDKTVLARTRSGRDRENKRKWLLSLRAMGFYSESDIEMLVCRNLDHERVYFQEAFRR